MTFCQCGQCESSRRGMIETRHKPYRLPEPAKWLERVRCYRCHTEYDKKPLRCVCGGPVFEPLPTGDPAP